MNGPRKKKNKKKIQKGLSSRFSIAWWFCHFLTPRMQWCSLSGGRRSIWRRLKRRDEEEDCNSAAWGSEYYKYITSWKQPISTVTEHVFKKYSYTNELQDSASGPNSTDWKTAGTASSGQCVWCNRAFDNPITSGHLYPRQFTPGMKMCLI